MWCCDEAGPFQTVPHPGGISPEGDPARQPHEYMRNGTAKVLTLFHPADGRVRIEGVTTCPNAVLHPWLKRESSESCRIGRPASHGEGVAGAWQRWQAGLAVQPTLPAESPPLRMLLVLDNLAGHKTPEFVLWLFAHGFMPIYTPVGGSWLNRAESIQRVLKRRALDGRRRRQRRRSSPGWRRWRGTGTRLQRRSSGAASGRPGGNASASVGAASGDRAPKRGGRSGERANGLMAMYIANNP